MKSPRKVVGVAVVIILLGLVAAVLAARYASQHVPEFYEKAALQDPQRAREANNQLIEQATGLAESTKKPGEWTALFTSEQINGWLAVDLVENHAESLPPDFKDPRVAISPGTVMVACKYDGDWPASVLSLQLDIALAEPNVIAIRFKSARAGMMPLPLSTVLESIKAAAIEQQWPLEWRSSGVDPVALITIPAVRIEKGRRTSLELTQLQLREGEIFVSGKSERIKE